MPDVVDDGTDAWRSARTTCCPAFKPDVMEAVVDPSTPTVTTVVVTFPALYTATVLRVPALVIADDGTVSVCEAEPVTIVTDAPIPCNAGALPVMFTVTGYVVVPDEAVLARMPTLLTTASTAELEPDTTTRAFWPTLTLGICASGTETTTLLAPEPTSVTAAGLVDAALPSVAPTDATRPLIGARSTVLSRATWAATSDASAWSTCAWSEASRLAELAELEVEPCEAALDRLEFELLDGELDEDDELEDADARDNTRASPFNAICSDCCAFETAACAWERAVRRSLHC